MSENVEWGPWVDHDGKGCPVEGHWVRVVFRDGEAMEGYVDPSPGDLGPFEYSCWIWSSLSLIGRQDFAIVRYRIRKPRALLDLIQIAAQPYAPPPVIHPEGPTRAPQPEGVPA